MDTSIKIILPILLILFSGCKKDNSNLDNVDQLPPATQTGANTFGCLINGKVWVPKGFDGNFVNSRINIDPGYMDGDLTIRTYRIEGDFIYDIAIASDSIKNIENYPMGKFQRAKFVIQKSKRDLSINYCLANGNTIAETSVIGYIKVTRYDLTNRIFSGEFEFTFSNNDCGIGNPISITNGRFDYKL